MTDLTQKEKDNIRKYRMQFFPPILFYMVWVFLVPLILDKIGDGFWTIPFALSQLIPLIFVARAIVGFFKRSDELAQILCMKAAVTTVIIITFFCMGYGFLEIRGYPHIPLFLIGSSVIPIFFISLHFYRKAM